MKKTKTYKLPKISADDLAKALRARFPVNKLLKEDRALHLATKTARTLAEINTGDVNEDFFDIVDIKKNERLWTQVANILRK